MDEGKILEDLDRRLTRLETDNRTLRSTLRALSTAFRELHAAVLELTAALSRPRPPAA